MSPATADPDKPEPVVASDGPVLLVGAGPVAAQDLKYVHSLAPTAVAADGGASALLDAGFSPQAVIGDMDSLTDQVRARVPPEALHPLSDQDSTDFEKCLTRIKAPLVLAIGFSGGRMDHLLAALNAMVRHPRRRCMLVGPEDIAVLLPPTLELSLPEGAPVSLFPLAPVSAQSRGLQWPVAGLRFRPDDQIGTSNRATGLVDLRCNHPGMLLFLARDHLGQLLAALDSAPRW